MTLAQRESFKVIEPSSVIRLNANMTLMQIHDCLALAAIQTPRKVIFEQAAYKFSPCGEAFIDLTEASDMAMDGNGSTFVFTGRTSFVRLRHVLSI